MRVSTPTTGCCSWLSISLSLSFESHPTAAYSYFHSNLHKTTHPLSFLVWLCASCCHLSEIARWEVDLIESGTLSHEFLACYFAVLLSSDSFSDETRDGSYSARQLDENWFFEDEIWSWRWWTKKLVSRIDFSPISSSARTSHAQRFLGLSSKSTRKQRQSYSITFINFFMYKQHLQLWAKSLRRHALELLLEVESDKNQGSQGYSSLRDDGPWKRVIALAGWTAGGSDRAAHMEAARQREKKFPDDERV